MGWPMLPSPINPITGRIGTPSLAGWILTGLARLVRMSDYGWDTPTSTPPDGLTRLHRADQLKQRACQTATGLESPPLAPPGPSRCCPELTPFWALGQFSFPPP